MTETPMLVYTPGQNGDAELLEWYLRLIADGSLAKIHGDAPLGLAQFMRQYTEPDVTLVYQADATGWWIVGWVKPFMGIASWGLWVREDRRGSAGAVEFAFKLHEWALGRWPALLLATSQPQVVAQMAPLGYAYVGEVPHLFGGPPGAVMCLDRAGFQAKLEAWKDKHNGRSTRRSEVDHGG